MTIREQDTEKKSKSTRKTKMEILTTIKNFIESEDPLVFNKSSMIGDPWNLDPRTVEEFLHIVHFCQNHFPPIQILVKNNKKKTFQQLDFQEMKREIENFSLKSIRNELKENDFLNPKLYPVFKCRLCGLELGYPSHHNEPMNHHWRSGKLSCNSKGCNFTQQDPEHHNKRMEVFVKHVKENDQKEDDWLQEETIK